MSERVPMQPVDGLARTATLPPPPARRPSAQAVPDLLPAPNDGPAPIKATQPKPAAPTRRPASDTADIIRSTTLSMTVDLIQAFKARATEDRISQPELLMDAISATHDRLPQLVQDAKPTQATDGLFVRRTTTTPGPTAVLSLRMLERNIRVIDDLAVATGSKSRSALCAAALENYLKDQPAGHV